MSVFDAPGMKTGWLWLIPRKVQVKLTWGILNSAVSGYTGLCLSLSVSSTTNLHSFHVWEEHVHSCELKPLIPSRIVCAGLCISLWLEEVWISAAVERESSIHSWILCKLFTLNMLSLLFYHILMPSSVFLQVIITHIITIMPFPNSTESIRVCVLAVDLWASGSQPGESRKTTLECIRCLGLSYSERKMEQIFAGLKLHMILITFGVNMQAEWKKTRCKYMQNMWSNLAQV